MDTLAVSGGFPLRGSIRASGSKFSVIPILAGTLLVGKEVKILNVPPISDVYTMFSSLYHLGAIVSGHRDTVTINADDINDSDVPDELIGSMRGTFLLFPALLARRGHASISQPQGCQIGPRPFFEHVDVITSFGASVNYKDGRYAGNAKCLHSSDFELSGAYPSPGATKVFLIMAAATKGTSVLKNASILPEVVEFSRFLQILGVEVCIEGTTITVNGGEEMKSGVIAVEVDRIECLTWAVLAGVTNGEITITNGSPSLSIVQEEWDMLQRLGLNVSRSGDSVTIVGCQSVLGGVDITTGAYPAFNTDAHPLFTSLLMKGVKPSTITENVFGSYRFAYLEELRKMGGLFKVSGNTVQILRTPSLHGSVVHGGDIRATASIIIASMGANGESMISGIEYFARGYGDFVQKAQSLGAHIRKIGS